MLLLELTGQPPERYLSATIDPLALFMIIGAGLLIAGLLYAIFSSDDDAGESDHKDPPSLAG